jgi:hypothetical protein
MKSIIAGRCSTAEFKRAIHYAAPEPGTELKAVLEPSYWANYARMLSVNDRIEVSPEDGTWWAELLVREVRHAFAAVAIISKVEFAASAVDDIDFAGHIIRYAGPARQWVVIRKAKGKLPETELRENFASSEAARDYVKQNIPSGVAA